MVSLALGNKSHCGFLTFGKASRQSHINQDPRLPANFHVNESSQKLLMTVSQTDLLTANFLDTQNRANHYTDLELLIQRKHDEIMFFVVLF